MTIAKSGISSTWQPSESSANGTSCFACHELLCSRAFLFISLLYCGVRSAHKYLAFLLLQIFRGIRPMPLPLLNHSARALFAQGTRIPPSARSIGFCVIWVCNSSSSIPFQQKQTQKHLGLVSELFHEQLPL